MSKKILLLLSVLCLTILLSACAKTVNEDELENANFTNEILSIKSINTFEEMITNDYEPKFEITNTYKDGDIPYLNFEFEGKESVNNLMKAYALTRQSAKLIIENTNEEFYFKDFSVTIEPTTIENNNGTYLLINITILNECYNSKFYDLLVIDLINKKLLTNNEIINLFNIDVDASIENLIKIYSEDEYTYLMEYNTEEQITKLRNYFNSAFNNFSNNKNLYYGNKIFNNDTKISNYAYIIDDFELEAAGFGYGTSIKCSYPYFAIQYDETAKQLVINAFIYEPNIYTYENIPLITK